MSTICVIAAHPDDDLLGAGGTLAKMIKEGHEVHALYMARGCPVQQWAEREAMAQCAGEIMGYKSLTFFRFPDQRLEEESLLELSKKIRGYLDTLRPEMVFVHSWQDLNIDHRRTCEATLLATRMFTQNYIHTLLGYNVDWLSLPGMPIFQCDVFRDITLTRDTKVNALLCYKTEMREFPHPRSFEALAAQMTSLGALCGFEWAEGFHSIFQR